MPRSTLALAGEDLQRLVASTDDLIAIADFDGRILHLSPSWQSALGRDLDVPGRLLDMVHPDDVEMTVAWIGAMIRQSGPHRFRNRIVHKDGGTRILDWTANADHPHRRFYAIARDVTELAGRETNMTRHNEDLEAFAFMLAHDIRSPLRAVAGLLGLLRRRKDAPREEVDEILHMAIDRIRTADEMAGSLLAYARMGDASVETDQVDMARIARDVVLMFRETGQSVGHIEVQEVPPCRGDAALLREALTNLIQNAIIHTTGTDARIVVSGQSSAGSVRYCVHDNGPGVTMAEAERIWEPLARGRHGGTGLGLAIVRRVAEAHGGSVCCQSGEGRGATFSFEIPA